MRKETKVSLVFTGLGMLMSVGMMILAIQQHDAAMIATMIGICAMYLGILAFFTKRAIGEAREAKALATH